MMEEGDIAEERNFQEGDSEIDAEEARAAVKHNEEMEEAKQELADLKGSEDEELYGGLNPNVQRPVDDEDEQQPEQNSA